MFRIKKLEPLIVVIIIIFIVSTWISPIIVYSGGLKFGIISVVKDKIEELKKKKKEKEEEIQERNIVKPGKNTKVLSDETVKHLVKQEDSTYYFDRQATGIEDINEGDIIISTKDEGFLRKVTAVNVTVSEYVVETSASTLEEAFEEVNIKLQKALTPNDLSSQRAPQLRKGVSIRPGLVAGEFYAQLTNVVLYDDDGNLETTNDQIVANGSITFKLSVDFRLIISWFDLKELKFVKTVQETANLEIASAVGASLEKEVEIVKLYFSAIPVGPIIFIPEVSLVVGGEADIGIVATAGITQQATFSAGITYNRGEWAPVGGFSSDFQFDAPSLSAEGSIKGYTGPKLAFKIYGMVGPYVNANGYLKLAVESSSPNLKWTLYGGLEGLGGVEMTILSFIKVGYRATLIDYEKVIASGEIGMDDILYDELYGAGIYKMNLEDNFTVQLSTFGWHAKCTADFERIAFGDYYNDGIWTMNSDGTNKRQLSSVGVAPSWSPDGNKICYDTGEVYTSQRRIWIMNSDGSNQHQLSNTPGSFPNWSPEGSKIIYHGEVATGIWVINYDGTNENCLNSSGGQPAWSPDGTQICYINFSDRKVWIMNADGTNKKRLSTNQGSLPQWSIDGRFIAFGDPLGHEGIFIIGVDGTNEHLIRDKGHAPSWIRTTK